MDGEVLKDCNYICSTLTQKLKAKNADCLLDAAVCCLLEGKDNLKDLFLNSVMRRIPPLWEGDTSVAEYANILMLHHKRLPSKKMHQYAAKFM